MENIFRITGRGVKYQDDPSPTPRDQTLCVATFGILLQALPETNKGTPLKDPKPG